MIFSILPSGYCVELNSIIFKPKSKILMMVFGALRVVYRGWECSQSNRGAILLRSRFAVSFSTFSKNIFSIESKLNFIEKSQNFHFPQNRHFWDSNTIVMVLTRRHTPPRLKSLWALGGPFSKLRYPFIKLFGIQKVLT